MRDNIYRGIISIVFLVLMLTSNTCFGTENNILSDSYEILEDRIKCLETGKVSNREFDELKGRVGIVAELLLKGGREKDPEKMSFAEWLVLTIGQPIVTTGFSVMLVVVTVALIVYINYLRKYKIAADKTKGASIGTPIK